jgi:hypothetical protein
MRTTEAQSAAEKENRLPGYPIYPESEDIYTKFREEKDVNPEDISRKKEVSDNAANRRSPKNDLDVPGAELDDAQEEIGSEDEENNYYSIGGDDHTDLDEKHDDD